MDCLRNAKTHQSRPVVPDTLLAREFSDRQSAVTEFKYHSTKQGNCVVTDPKKSNNRRVRLVCRNQSKDERFCCNYRVVIRKRRSGMWRATDDSNMNHVAGCISKAKITYKETQLLHKGVDKQSRSPRSIKSTGDMIAKDNTISTNSVPRSVATRVRLDDVYESIKDYDVNWTRLDGWGREFVRLNPGSRFHLEVDKESRFLRMFVGLGVQAIIALLCGLNFSGIDGTHFTHVEFRGGVALLLVTRDGNNQIVILAYVICLVENKPNYVYFKEQVYLMPHLRAYLDRAEQLLYSDRQKGLPGFSSGFKAGKGDCIKHIEGNTRDHCRSKGEAPSFHKNQIFAIQKCVTISDFTDKLDKFRRKWPIAAAYLNALKHENTFLYAIILLGFTTYGHGTNNISEIGNWVIQPQRCVSKRITDAQQMHTRCTAGTRTMHK